MQSWHDFMKINFCFLAKGKHPCKLHASPKHVKDLLEIQWEATRGSYYVKPEEAMPTLALYVLDECCYLLIDLPRGASMCVSLADDFDVEEIRNACFSADQRHSLPRQIEKQLTLWRQANAPDDDKIKVKCRWQDPVRAIGVKRNADHRRIDNFVTVRKLVADLNVALKVRLLLTESRLANRVAISNLFSKIFDSCLGKPCTKTSTSPQDRHVTRTKYRKPRSGSRSSV